MKVLFYPSDKVLAEGRGNPFPSVYTTVHPDGLLFHITLQTNLGKQTI